MAPSLHSEYNCNLIIPGKRRACACLLMNKQGGDGGDQVTVGIETLLIESGRVKEGVFGTRISLV